MKHFKYLSYVARHKWFVFKECASHGLYMRGLLHDWHKFLPGEWFPYVEYFYGEAGSSIVTKRDASGYRKPTDTGDLAFDFAWLLHQKRSDHHWQWWTLPEDEGGLKVLPMSVDARLEMVCDWLGASRAQGKGGLQATRAWYEINKGKMQLHPATREWVEFYLFPELHDDQTFFW